MKSVYANVYLLLSIAAVLIGLSFSSAANASGLCEDLVTEKVQESFDPVRWKKPNYGRLSMVNDFVHNYKIIGMSRVRVHDLLGAPAPVNTAADELGSSDTTDTYALTSASCGNAPTTYLNITYDGDAVKSYCLRTRRLGVGVTNKFSKLVAENFPEASKDR